jgi:hypothetical protein
MDVEESITDYLRSQQRRIDALLKNIKNKEPDVKPPDQVNPSEECEGDSGEKRD